MAGIYLHIPFCKQACHYCDFHFSTSLKTKEQFLHALTKEMVMRKNELESEKIETIYLGGGTPSILDTDEIKKIIEVIFNTYSVIPNAEITLEANPDDLTAKKLTELKQTVINRFSIGVQSFFEDDLLYMNRVHNAQEAERAIKTAQDIGFENITIDLIYGTPTLTNEKWLKNLQNAIEFKVPHISSYALTVEEKTPLKALIQSKKLQNTDDHQIADQFMMLIETLTKSNFEHYEISNFAQEGFQSKHNSAYWSGKSYLGFGPSAHSYNGTNKRRWNVANNILYSNKITDGKVFYEEENLSDVDRFNEFIMTRIRLKEGIGLNQINEVFGTDFKNHVLNEISGWDTRWYAVHHNFLLLSNEGKIISDRLASQLFYSKS